tara:strand:+ start:562 stop:2025 length:1464 start_codon:yes stop_codon:yes gene_type:complete
MAQRRPSLLNSVSKTLAGVSDFADDLGRMYDERFDNRKREVERLNSFEVEVLRNQGYAPPPTAKLSDFEGMPFVTSMSDRTDAQGEIIGIDGVRFNDPVMLRGGQGYMFDDELNPGQVWASARNPVNQIIKAAGELKETYGKDPLYIPWRMAPTGGDFATMTGETMMAYASAAMSPSQKKALDKAIRDYETVGEVDRKTKKRKNAGLKIKGWKGVDDPRSVEVWRNTPDAVRKEIKDRVFDKQFRNDGSLSIGQARLAVAEPAQVNARDAGIQNVGRIYTGKDPMGSTHPAYPYGVPGEGIAQLSGIDDVSIFELLPGIRLGKEQLPVVDPINPTDRNVRAMQMAAKSGVITEDVLRNLSDRGVNVAVTGLPTGLLAGTTGEDLMVRSADGTSRPMNDMELAMYEDSQRSIAPALEALAPDEGFAYGDVLPIKRMTDEDAREEDMFGGFRPAFPNMVRDTAADLVRASQALKTGMLDEQAYMNLMAP